jgi:peptide/nickel transport system permease protein
MRRLRFVAHRLASGLVVIIGVSLLIFLLARVMPGDPARLALGPSATPDQVAHLRHEMGLDRPVLVQYATFIGGALRLDFGMSLYTDQPVASDLAKDFPATLELALTAGLIMGVFGIGMGVTSARHKDAWPDNASRLFSLLAVAMPNFVWALILMLVLSYWLGVLPIAGRLGEDLLPPPPITGLFTIDALLAGQFGVFLDALRHLVLPAIALALPGLAQIARLTRTNVVDSYARPYVEFARAYGLAERAIAARWALRPAIIPTFTVLGMQVVALLGSAFLIETVFDWPGMARYGVQAILHKDLNAITAVVLLISIAFVVINMAIDGAVALIDPRIRAGIAH